MTANYDPTFYDLVTPASFGGDADWYRHKASEAGGPVLELGAGTGRITIPIAQDGVSIHALDANRGMLDALRRKIMSLRSDVQKRIVVVEADMRSFKLDQTFALAIVPYRAFLHNLTTEDQLACLRSIHDHLIPQGRLAFNVFHPSLEFMAQHAGSLAGVWRWSGTYPQPDGRQLVRSEANKYDTVRRRVYSQHRFELYENTGTLARTFLQQLELAYLYPADIERLLQQAGFEEIIIKGDFNDRAFERDTDELVVEARRASSVT